MTSTSDHTSCAGVPAQLEAVRRQVLDLTETLWAARPRMELVETVTGIEALKSTLDALELDLVGELEATDGVKVQGWASTKDFCTAVSGGHRGSGPAIVHLADDLQAPVHAPVAAALRDGWLSTAKAQVITRAVDRLPAGTDRAEAVRLLLDEAKRLDASELKRAGRHLLRVLDPDGEDRRDEAALDREERAAHHSRFLSIRDDNVGGARIKGRCTAEDAAMIRATLLSLSAPQPADGPTCDPRTCREPGCRHDGKDPRDHGARMLDALVETCRRAQTAEVLPTEHGATPRLTLLMKYGDLLAGLGVAVTETGEEIPASAIRRICCDAEVIPAVLGSDSEILDVGRTRRLVTPAIWKALVARDRHCRFPGCRRPPIMCHAHHIVHWLDHGPTSLENLILLCGHHHRLVHSGPWHLELARDGAAHFIPPPGVDRERLITARPPPDPPPDIG
ncbi:MAG TPA: DUF222 domain-containing protein [Marmoricola sp.]|jgi:hypothetical protein|nr:DUF222 domain-containing protein [Marmoricola sp.]